MVSDFMPNTLTAHRVAVKGSHKIFSTPPCTGGPSAAIAHVFGAAAAMDGETELLFSEAGAGGLGGSPAVGAGAAGEVVKVLELQP